MKFTLIGLILIVFGVFYIRNPMIYRRGIWLKTSLAIRSLSEERYKKYIKGLGAIYIVAGIGLIVWEQVFVQFGLF
jgi:hypothetical protein